MKNVTIQKPQNQLAGFSQSELDCPVDGVKVNENKVRTVAFFVLLIAITHVFTSFWLLPVVLLVDFALRAFDYGKFSPFARISDTVVKALHFPVRPIDQAPKRFAAGVGMVFAASILTVDLLGGNPLVLTITLALFAALESLVGICAGCYVYTLLKRSKIIN
ncbi:DUF4395 domain-containing protein [Spirosoma aureum]|uniref:DUF4395 domain-containing protein n=1 Tax=Spirosoma aureum TaxID=2692134 RepID=A0A6G9AK39_9BACT|nr:DUF4395 domain-containing protein [Spirosoma aureum]QIP12832.1 DUF4395 domain-containing protein [Spirosoma aureum]